MSYTEFLRHLGKAGISVKDFARCIGVRAGSMSNYRAKGKVPRKHAILAVLMGDAADRQIDFLATLKKYGINMPNSGDD
jgi:hypothetical protein